MELPASENPRTAAIQGRDAAVQEDGPPSPVVQQLDASNRRLVNLLHELAELQALMYMYSLFLNLPPPPPHPLPLFFLFPKSATSLAIFLQVSFSANFSAGRFGESFTVNRFARPGCL